MARWWLLLALLTVAGCRCDGGPATGTCTGTWAGATVSAEVDGESRYVVIYPSSCAGTSVRVFQLAFGGGKVKLNFSPSPAKNPSILSTTELVVPGVDAPNFSIEPAVTGSTGTMKLSVVGAFTRRTGTVTMTAGAETLTCTFDVPFATEGVRPSCGSSGGGDFD